MTMSREQFDGHVITVFSSAMNWRGENHITWPHGDESHYKVEWIMGGLTGGNCWGDSANQAVEPEPEPDLPLLDELLENICPDMRVKDYKQILVEVVCRSEHSSYEYYGNYTTRGTKTVWFSQLYRELCDRNLI